MSARDIMKLKAAIRAIAQEEGVMAQAVLQTFMFERLLARLVKTPVRESLVVKGGLLLSNLLGLAKRTTMDLDASVRNTKLTEENLQKVLTEVFAVDVGDGVVFAIKSVDRKAENEAHPEDRLRPCEGIDRKVQRTEETPAQVRGSRRGGESRH